MQVVLPSLYSRCSSQKMACSAEDRLRAVVDFSQYQTPYRSTRALLSRSKSNLNNGFYTGYKLSSSLAILCSWILAPSLFVQPITVEKHKEVKKTKLKRSGKPTLPGKTHSCGLRRIGDFLPTLMEWIFCSIEILIYIEIWSLFRGAADPDHLRKRSPVTVYVTNCTSYIEDLRLKLQGEIWLRFAVLFSADHKIS